MEIKIADGFIEGLVTLGYITLINPPIMVYNK